MNISKQARQILDKIDREKNWVKKRYSPLAIARKLNMWESLLHKLAEEQRIDVKQDEIFKFFYLSYFRSIGSKKYKSRLTSQLMSSITNIKKERLLKTYCINGKFNSENNRWREFKYERLESRFSEWQNEIKKAVPEINDDEIFRFFRKRYIQVAEKRFRDKEIPVGIKNTREYIKKKTKLENLYITKSHPQFEYYTKMAPWEFNRKYKTLYRTLELLKRENLNFPLTKNSTNKREYQNHLKRYSLQERPDYHEEMLYKLILHFNGMTKLQIENIYHDFSLKPVDITKALDKLVFLELIEEHELTNNVFYTRISDEAKKELIIDKWLEDLRKNISIGTGEALNYLENSYKDYSIKKLQNEVLPNIAKKIMDDRKYYLIKMGIDNDDPRYYKLIQQKKSDIADKLENFETIFQDFREKNIEIPEDVKIEISSYSENGNEGKDTQVFWLIHNLKESTYQQLSNIYKTLNNGKIGFKLKASLTRLAASGLIKTNKKGLIQTTEM